MSELKPRNGSRYLVLIEPPGSPSKRFWMIACRWGDGWWNAWDEPGQKAIQNVIGWLDLPPTDTRAVVGTLTPERVREVAERCILPDGRFDSLVRRSLSEAAKAGTIALRDALLEEMGAGE